MVKTAVPEMEPIDEAFDRLGKERTELPWASDLMMALYIQLSKIKDEANAWAKRVQAAYDAVEPDVVDYFKNEGKQSDKRQGRTVYLAKELWPRINDEDLMGSLPEDASKELIAETRERARARLIEALAADPTTEHLVKSSYNNQTLRSYILHDCEEDPETLEKVIPEHLEGLLGVSERWRAKVLRS